MNYGAIKKTDIANGPGVRVSLFVSGCRNRCKGCFNPETWDFNYGELFNMRVIDDILEALAPDHIAGLTVLGGDPMEPENIIGVDALSRAVKEKYPDKTIWIYTGYTYERLKNIVDVMEYIDVLVDGPFIESKKDISLKFRGSSNQRIIDVPKSRESEKVVLWEG
jgi:anaerobic ribonucleoside-triphosphate reductase activating protein